MIPPVRALLSTSWDPAIRRAIAKEKAESAADSTKSRYKKAGRGQHTSTKETVGTTQTEETAAVDGGAADVVDIVSSGGEGGLDV